MRYNLLMDISQSTVKSEGIKLSAIDDSGLELGYIYLFILHNRPDSHYGFLENLYVAESARGRGIGTHLLQAAVNKARDLGCYKLICTSRYSNKLAHQLYLKHGFTDFGHEFRLDLI